MLKTKLKPCPFCGGKVVHYHTNHISLMRRTHAFRCEGCETLFYIPAKSKYASEEDTEKEAVTTFNKMSLMKTADIENFELMED